MRVFSLLHTAADRQNVRLVCSHWNRCMNVPELWSELRLHVTTSRFNKSHWSLLQARSIVNLTLGPFSPSLLSRSLKRATETLPKLQCLSILVQKYKRETVYNLQGLVGFHKLRQLSVSGSAVSVAIPGLPSLKEMQLCNKVQVNFTGCFENLNFLAIDSFQDGNLPLDNFPQLAKLSLKKGTLKSDMFGTPDGCDGKQFQRLSHLDLTYSTISESCQQFFHQFPSLCCLNLTQCGLREADLVCVVELLTGLNELLLTGTYNLHVHVYTYMYKYVYTCINMYQEVHVQ